MELFSEIYSSYYQAVGRILAMATEGPLSKQQITALANKYAFSESALSIVPKLLGEWCLMEQELHGGVSRSTSGSGSENKNKNKNKNEDKSESVYQSCLFSSPKRPMTKLELSWLKALLTDKRIGLFLDKQQVEQLILQLEDVEPLYQEAQFHYYDVYRDGDAYENPCYCKHFREIFRAVKSKEFVYIEYEGSKGTFVKGTFLPYRLEYSSKDDKFRVHARRKNGDRLGPIATINIARITLVTIEKDMHELAVVHRDRIDQRGHMQVGIQVETQQNSVTLEISKERNALERCMLHFASYEKRTEFDEATGRYLSTIYYNKQDETELLIRILSFGPVIRVLGPQPFLSQVRERVKRQTTLLQSEVLQSEGRLSSIDSLGSRIGDG